MRFIYVKSDADKEKMLKLGYSLIKKCGQSGIWVFLNKDAKTFDHNKEIDNSGIQYVLSSTLTF